MRGACIRLTLSRMMPVPLRLPHNYTPVFFNTLALPTWSHTPRHSPHPHTLSAHTGPDCTGHTVFTVHTVVIHTPFSAVLL